MVTPVSRIGNTSGFPIEVGAETADRKEAAMSIQPPTRSDVETAARHYGFTLGQQDLAGFHDLVTTNLDSHRRVADLYELSRLPGRRRHGSFPSTQDNPLGAWYVRTTLRGALSGPAVR